MKSRLENLKILLHILFVFAVIFVPIGLLELWIMSYDIGQKAMNLFFVVGLGYIVTHKISESTSWGRRLRAKVCVILRTILRIEVRVTPAQALRIATEEVRALTQTWLVPSTLSELAIVIEQLSSYLVRDHNFQLSINATNGAVLECYSLPSGKGPRWKIK